MFARELLATIIIDCIYSVNLVLNCLPNYNMHLYSHDWYLKTDIPFWLLHRHGNRFTGNQLLNRLIL